MPFTKYPPVNNRETFVTLILASGLYIRQSSSDVVYSFIPVSLSLLMSNFFPFLLISRVSLSTFLLFNSIRYTISRRFPSPTSSSSSPCLFHIHPRRTFSIPTCNILSLYRSILYYHVHLHARASRTRVTDQPRPAAAESLPVTGARDGSEQRKGGPLKKRKKEEKNTGKIRAVHGVYLHNFFSPFGIIVYCGYKEKVNTA